MTGDAGHLSASLPLDAAGCERRLQEPVCAESGRALIEKPPTCC